MRAIHCEQGSREWFELRLGLPTASQFKRIVTPTGKKSGQWDGYLGDLLAEWALGEPAHDFDTEWIERGRALEPEAFSYYGVVQDVTPTKIGFCLHDSGCAGCSPDGLVGEDGLLELKCPMPGKHLVYVVRNEVPKEYVPQVQGQLWVTGRLWCDFMSYCPGLPPLITRAIPDPRYQEALDELLPVFAGDIDAGRRWLADLGVKGWMDDGDSTQEPGRGGSGIYEDDRRRAEAAPSHA